MRRPHPSAVERIVTPEMQELLYDKAEALLSRLIDRYVPGPQLVAQRVAEDPHRILGLRVGCSAADVRRRVKELAKVFHPDLSTGDADKMAEINGAAQQILAMLGGR